MNKTYWFITVTLGINIGFWINSIYFNAYDQVTLLFMNLILLVGIWR